jgi:hypothetical protein
VLPQGRLRRPGVVDEDVDAAEGPEHLGHDGLDVVLVGHVEGQADDPPAGVGGDGLGGGRGPAGGEVGDDQVGPGPGQAAGGGLADPRSGGGGDEGDPAGEVGRRAAAAMSGS